MAKIDVFSGEFAASILSACEELVSDGTCATREAIAEHVAQTKRHPDCSVLATLVGEAVKQGAVEGVAMRLGRDGGIYMPEAVKVRKATAKATHDSEVEARAATRAEERAAVKALAEAERAAAPPVKRGRPKKVVVEAAESDAGVTPDVSDLVAEQPAPEAEVVASA